MIHETVLLFGNPKIHRTARVDAYSILTGNIQVRSHVHVGCSTRLMGGGGLLTLGCFCGVSPGATIFTATDDYNHSGPLGPLVPDDLRKVIQGDVTLEPLSCVGAHSVVMPGCVLRWGSRLGANSFLIGGTMVPDGEIWAGNPARKVGQLDLQKLEAAADELKHRGLWPVS